MDLHQDLSTLLGHGRAPPGQLLHQARHHCVALLPSRIHFIVNFFSLDQDCLLCVTGCKNNVLAGILQNRICLNDHNESLSVHLFYNFLSHPRLMKLIKTKQLFVNLHLPVRSNLGGVEQPIERVLTLPPECQLQQNQQ